VRAKVLRERDEHYMSLALTEAARGDWRTHPNPMVGAVVVRGDAVLATGYHEAAGQDHAEVVALRKLGMQAQGAELFVTLEPCHHHGRTPPCTSALIGAGISRCVIGSVDPDPRVSGRGIAALGAAGVVCEVGVLEAACQALNAPFFKRVLHGLPYVTLKMAMTLDGRIATVQGSSQWISGEASRAEVQEMRRRHDAVMVGTGTVAADDPRLTVRSGDGPRRQPLRVVLDRRLRLRPEAQVFDGKAATLLFTREACLGEGVARFAGRDIEVQSVGEGDAGLDLGAVLRRLVSSRRVTTLLCEGGGELAASLLSSSLVDELVVFVAPKVVGGRTAPGPVGGLGVGEMAEALSFDFVSWRQVGADLCLVAKPRIAATRGG